MRVLAWIVASVLSVAVLVVGGAVAALFIIDWNDWREDAAALAGDMLGREVRIGRLDVTPGWTVHVKLRDVVVAHADDGAEGDFARLGEAEFGLRVWPSLTDTLTLPYVRVSQGDVDLVRDADGGNWLFDDDDDDDDDDETPRIGRIDVADSRIRYRDRERGIDLRGAVAASSEPEREDRALTAKLEGTLGSERLNIDFAGGVVRSLDPGDAPYPLKIDVVSGETRIRAEGTIGNLRDLGDFSLDVAVRGPGLGQLMPSLDLPLPNTPPYDLSGKLSREGERWDIRNLSGTIGRSDLSGRLAVDLSEQKPMITGDLVSERLLLDDLAEFIGLPSGTAAPAPAERRRADAGRPAEDPAENGEPRAAPEARKDRQRHMRGIFPDVPLDIERLQGANADVRYRAKEFRSELLPFERVSWRVVLRDRRLDIRDLEAAIARGTLKGTIAIDARKQPPTTEADLTLDDLDLRPFFKGSRFLREMGGEFSGRVFILGTGDTMAKVMANAGGGVRLGIRKGTLSGLLVEAAGLDLVEALALVIEDARIPIRCGAVDAVLRKGILRTQRVIVDTTDSTLIAGGRVDLDKQTLAVQVEARAKDFSLIDLSAPVVLKGPLTDPSFSIGGVDPLPFFETGDQEDVDCDAVLNAPLISPAK